MCQYCEARENLCWGNEHSMLIAELKDLDTDSPLNRFVIATKKNANLLKSISARCAGAN